MRFGYAEIRTPIFEYTPLFARSIGEVTDIVEKEMYTIPSARDESALGEDSLTLRPEFTASVVRAVIEHNLFARRSLQKLFYCGPLFRRERPQKARYRQFHQMGIEALGSYDPLLDAETIRLAGAFLDEVDVHDHKVLLNTMGCPECRSTYRAALQSAAQKVRDSLCENCRGRLERNVFRILDCKVEKCAKAGEDFPPNTEFLCEKCRAHFTRVKCGLEDIGVDFELKPRLVRGFDYYTHTVYELIVPELGPQASVCGGGRYDNLVEGLGGPKAGAIGFAIGIERTILAMKAADDKRRQAGIAAGSSTIPAQSATGLTTYIAVLGDAGRKAGFRMLNKLRSAGISADMDYEDKSLKAQMRLANKLTARYVVVIGEDELRRGSAKIRDMAESKETEVALDQVAARLKQPP
jgi:histidyl-tRNA synthetase